MTIWDELRYFKKSEFGQHADEMNEQFLKRLDTFRYLCGFPIVITASFDANGSHAPNGYHPKGLAVDTRCNDDAKRRKMLEVALKMDFKGIGVYDKHIHLDDRDGDRAVLWVGVSK